MLRLVESARFTALAVLAYPDMATAADAVPSLIPLRPLALEGMDARLVQVLRSSRGPRFSVTVVNGWMALTVMPSRPRCTASAFVKLTTAELRAPAEMEPAWRAVLPARLMIRPYFPWRISGTALVTLEIVQGGLDQRALHIIYSRSDPDLQAVAIRRVSIAQSLRARCLLAAGAILNERRQFQNAVPENECALDAIFQFAHVARP